MRTYAPVEIIEGIFYFYPSTRLRNDREKIHTAFYLLRRKYPDVLGDILFRQHPLFPRSHMLDELLSALQPDFLSKLNPTYGQYEIKQDSLKKQWQRKLRRRLRPITNDLKTIAVELRDYIET